MKERLQKILSRAGVASRRAAEKLMEEGRVEVDGRVVTELGSSADPDSQEIRVDGARIRLRAIRRTVALHKPVGYVTTRSDPSRRKTVMDLLPHGHQSLFPVGRLDIMSTGLLLLTDDGELAQKVTHPRFGVSKTYLVTVAGRPPKNVLERAQRGIVVEGERLVLDGATLLGASREPRAPRPGEKVNTRLRVVLRQGKNREIRRLFRALGFPVLELHREKIGSLSVRGIPPGGFRNLTEREVEKLKSDASSGARPRRSRPVAGAKGQGSKRRPKR